MLLILDHCTTHKFHCSSSVLLLCSFAECIKNWIAEQFKSHGNSIRNVSFVIYCGENKNFFRINRSFEDQCEVVMMILGRLVSVKEIVNQKLMEIFKFESNSAKVQKFKF